MVDHSVVKGCRSFPNYTMCREMFSRSSLFENDCHVCRKSAIIKWVITLTRKVNGYYHRRMYRNYNRLIFDVQVFCVVLES